MWGLLGFFLQTHCGVPLTKTSDGMRSEFVMLYFSASQHLIHAWSHVFKDMW